MSNQLAVKDYLRQDSVIAEFRAIMGEREANRYIRSVLIAVSNSKALQECSPTSILTSAMRAATLNLEVDPSVGQAYLVPFKSTCTLIIGYKGIKDMALRTGRYRYLNVGPIYEGEEITEDRFTGMHQLSGGKQSNKVIGWLLYFELIAGFRKSFYMTVEEIHEHAGKYSKAYNFVDSPWKTATKIMEQKTVLRLGLGRWGYFDPHDVAVLSEIERAEDTEVIEAETVEQPAEQSEPGPDEPKRSDEQILLELGY